MPGSSEQRGYFETTAAWVIRIHLGYNFRRRRGQDFNAVIAKLDNDGCGFS